MKILDGKIIGDEILVQLKGEFAKLTGITKLAIIQVGARADSTAYIRQKKIFAEKVGVTAELFKFPENCFSKEIIEKIRVLNEVQEVHGIIVQLPLSANFNTDEIIESINPSKDVDGLTAKNLRQLMTGDLEGLMPATAKGVLKILDYYKIPIVGQRATIIGRSRLVGKPVALALLARGATVTICHKETKNIATISKEADILVTAVGQRNLIDKDFVAPNQTVIDIGNDVNFLEVKDIVGAITPTPGGVGPLTVACLFENLLKARIMSGQ
ncbi:MAG: 5,10-methylene-tetrahydrofolate dehydrogenase/methenyl tetrahydrofolate cyclohydrolase [Parcubacteria group bacterium Gr01-1014_73]|nr:MAG: 5,10-methylene-tetrahydrofolate dehydrogenase/methenyl tetrahydrofolate cyclohydrolase [Parcubacteria group bacterium Gr01-1014_73]